MQFYDINILIRNINILMDDNHMTQKQLADILGMSQPNVSKALNTNDKKCFTLDQVVGIATHFGISIDELVGNTVSKEQEISPRSVAKFISGLFESHYVKHINVDVEEKVYELQNVHNVFGNDYSKSVVNTKIITYPAVYFPDYWEVPTPRDNSDVEALSLLSEAEQLGNVSRMMDLNDFLRKYIQIYEIHESDGVDDEAYNTVVDSYVNKLRDY